MSPGVIGQRCVSEREPELGLGVVVSLDRTRIGIRFPATGEQRLYARDTPVLKRVEFRAGDTATTRDGVGVAIEKVEEEGGLLTYVGQGRRIREDEISDTTSVSLPPERLLAGQVDPGQVFGLRLRALQAQARFRQSDLRGFLGGRVDLIPHQFYILREVSARGVPRVLLADEVGLGKTIEACLILQRLLAVGQVKRVLILVPESLVHQWFVELLRRFNLWFGIYDEARCLACEQSDPGSNPFLAAQLVLASVGFLAGNEARREQAVAAGWDLAVVDEAHHLQWTAEAASPGYALVESLARRTPGLLLLTATPTQLGLAGHFARLRLLDPHRYDSYERFLQETEEFGRVTAIAEKVLARKPLQPKDRAILEKIFAQDPSRLDRHLQALAAGTPGAHEALLKTLLDQHGTGRVMFRNTRASLTGFPRRKLQPAPLPGTGPTLDLRIARELEAEETGQDGDLRYAFKEDPRIAWLADFLAAKRPAKVLLICKTRRKVLAIEAALLARVAVKTALFHEDLPLVQRDRNAAWFGEADGAQILLCSEIGSEGRNFQFAHHLVLFDLPLNPGLLEQRIGRLDRIGQTETIRIHVPYIAGSSTEVVLEWYHQGLDAFETPLHGGEAYQEQFKGRLLAFALARGRNAGVEADPAGLAAFLAETIAFRAALTLKMKQGRDRLLELNSFNREVAQRLIERIRGADADTFLRLFLCDLLDHFGVRVKEHEAGDVFLDPSHAYVPSFPSIPREGMLATFARARGLVREDIRFVSPDHPLVQDAIDLLIESKAGTTAFGYLKGPKPNLLLEAVFVLEAVADSRWQVDQFLAPQPVRVVLDLAGRDLTESWEPAIFAREVGDATIQRFLERPGFTPEVLKRMLERAAELADGRGAVLRLAADGRAAAALTADLERLVDLRKVNTHVRPEEITWAETQLARTREAIAQSRLRLDALRLVLEGPVSLG